MLLPLLGVIVLLLLNGIFVAAEFSLVRANPVHINAAAADGARWAILSQTALSQLNRSLAACQLGITLASIGIGFLGESAIGYTFERLFNSYLSDGLSTAISVLFAFTFVTAIHVVIGEQVPKMLGITRPEASLRWLITPVRLFSLLLRPAVWLLESASGRILRLWKISVDELHNTPGSGELREIVAQSGQSGHLDPGEASMLGGVFSLHERQARGVMTPAAQVVAVAQTTLCDHVLQLAAERGHSRLVVTNGQNDHVVGLAHWSDLAVAGETVSVKDVMKDIPIVPEGKPLDELLRLLQKEQSSLAAVVDEYGRLAGIVSVEDILEEIVGEIHDETDDDVASVTAFGDGWRVNGHLDLEDLRDEWGIMLEHDGSDSYTTIGGLVFHVCGHLPVEGEKIACGAWTISIEQMDEHRVQWLVLMPSVEE